MSATKQIIFYLDFVSPYAYLASTQIEALAAKHGYSVLWRPFLIGATFKVTGRKAPIQHPLVGDYMKHDVQRFARMLGQPLNFPFKFPILSVKPSRVFYYLEARDGDQINAKAFAAKVYQAYFVDQLNITNNEVLAALAAPFGLSVQDLEIAVSSVEMKDKFKAIVAEAIDRKVFGAPMFIVEDEMFWGVDRMDHLDQWLAKGAW
ncbi:MAG: 2-hydroxychromene-2-carboxylate isomerase [Arenicellales bacterium]